MDPAQCPEGLQTFLLDAVPATVTRCNLFDGMYVVPVCDSVVHSILISTKKST